MKYITLTLLTLLVFCSAMRAQNSIRYATPAGAGAKNGTSWANAYDNAAFCNALWAAPAGSAFYLSVGIFYPTRDAFGSSTPQFPRDKTFYLPDSVQVYGGFLGNETSLAQRPTVLFDLPAGGTTLSGDLGVVGDTLDNAYHVVMTAAVSAATRLDGCRVSDANNQGSAGTVVIKGIPFFQYIGGGMYNQSGSPTIENCIFMNNTAASQGGGMFNKNSNAQLKNCVFVGNKANQYGGGLYLSSGQGVLQNCIFHENKANEGGGIYDYIGGTYFRNCTFSNNKASYKGNAMRANSSFLVMVNCILWGVADTANTKAAYVKNGNPLLISSIVQGCGGTFAWDATAGVDGGGNKDLDPQFAQMGDPDGADNVWMTADDGLRPATGSPAVDAGTNFQATAQDAMGVARPQQVTYDMGAYELFVCDLQATVSAPPVACYGGSTAAAIQVSTGAGNYQYRIGATGFQPLNSFANLAAGAYSFTVKDAWGCMDTLHLTITQPAALSSSLTASTCAGAPYTFGSQLLTQTGVYQRTIPATSGCDSLITLTLTVLPLPATPIISRSNDTLRTAASGNIQWYLDGKAVAGGTTAVYALTQNGQYSVCVTDANGCRSCSAILTIANVSIDKNWQALVRAYPNPFSDAVIVDLPQDADFSGLSVQLCNLLGETLLTQPITSPNAILSTTSISSGMYLLQVMQGNRRMISLKMIKQ